MADTNYNETVDPNQNPTASASSTTSGTTGVLNPPTINQEAKDVATAQGVAYGNVSDSEINRPTADYANYDAGKVSSDINDTAAIKSGTSYMDQARGTVVGQLNSLLASDSPYIKAQEQKAKEVSASRGMLNSTLAAQAGRTAAINAALPIAQTDATEFNKFGLQQQNAENLQTNSKAEAIASGELVKQKAEISQTAQNLQNAFTSALAGANEESKTWLTALQNDHNKTMSEMQYTQNQVLQNQDISAKMAESVRTQTSAIMQNYQISVENLMKDPDFLNLGAEAMNRAVNTMQTLATNNVKFVGAASGIDMTPFLKYFSAVNIGVTKPPK